MEGLEKLLITVDGWEITDPRCFRNVKSKPVEYIYSARAWKTSDLFEKWLLKINKKFSKQLKDYSLLAFIDW